MAQDGVRDALRVRRPTGRVVPDEVLGDPGAMPVGPRSKSNGQKQIAGIAERLDALQEALYAEATGEGRGRSVLLVLQGMDTSGKGGTIRHVCGLLNPHGVRVAAFGRPTKAERRHHFLWRVRRQLPAPGLIGAFDRSHYEDVLVARVDELVPPQVWQRRYAEINEFEAELVEKGTTLIKCFLHISPEEQRRRLEARLTNPRKRWKYDPSDVDARDRWDDYQQAYAEALVRCSTEAAPWYVVPADHKWYRNWAVAELLLETLTEMAPRFPEARYDVEAELARLRGRDPVGVG